MWGGSFRLQQLCGESLRLPRRSREASRQHAATRRVRARTTPSQSRATRSFRTWTRRSTSAAPWHTHVDMQRATINAQSHAGYHYGGDTLLGDAVSSSAVRGYSGLATRPQGRGGQAPAIHYSTHLLVEAQGQRGGLRCGIRTQCRRRGLHHLAGLASRRRSHAGAEVTLTAHGGSTFTWDLRAACQLQSCPVWPAGCRWFYH